MRTRLIDEPKLTPLWEEVERLEAKVFECPCGKSVIKEATFYYKPGVGGDPMGIVAMECDDCDKRWKFFEPCPDVSQWELVPRDDNDLEASQQHLDYLIKALDPFIMTPERWKELTGENISNGEESETASEKNSEPPAGLNREKRRKWWKRNKKKR